MKHYIITNRSVVKKGGKEIINNNGEEQAIDKLRFGYFDTEKCDKPEDITVFSEPVNTSKLDYNVTVNDAGLVGSAAFFTDLYDSMIKSKGDVLVFVHGFKNNLMDAVEHVKEIEEQYIKAGSPIKRIVLFTWPSNGKVFEYRDDARDAELSGYTFGRCFLKLSNFFEQFFAKPENKECGNKIHLLCHSMGNYVWENAVKMIIDRSEQRRMFSEIILTASDINYMALEKPNPLSNITDFCKRVHIYFDNGDKALGVSTTTKNSAKRLGKDGPFNNWNLPRNVYVVDTSEVDDFISFKTKLMPTRHDNFKTSKKVIADVISVLKGEHSEQITGRTFIPTKNDFRL